MFGSDLFQSMKEFNLCVVLKAAACKQEGQVCGNGAPYLGSICCTGLQCDGSHCINPGGGKLKILVSKVSFQYQSEKNVFKRSSLLCLLACIHADSVCGNGAAYSNSKCLDGLRCDGKYCTKSKGFSAIFYYIVTV